MNLMFRKNFSESKGGGGGGGCSKGRKTVGRTGGGNKRGARDHGGGIGEEQYHHFRTHIFLAPPRSNYCHTGYEEPRCGPVLTSLGPTSALASGFELDTLPQQPLVVRNPSVSIPWPPDLGVCTAPSSPAPATSPPLLQPPPTPTSGVARQVSFGSSSVNSVGTAGTANPSNATSPISGMKQSRSEPISLSTLDRDCFIIPVQRLGRFLPAGLPVPSIVPGGVAVQEKLASPTSGSNVGSSTTGSGTVTSTGNISVLEVSDPKLCILAHLMSPLEPIDPVLESPLTQPLAKQKAAAIELLREVAGAHTALGGMLLANMERHSEFPFIAYYIINSAQTDPAAFYNNLRSSSLSKFDPRVLRYTAAHTLDLYSEVAAICRPPLQDPTSGLTRSHTPFTGFIISVYKVFEGDDGENFERNWLYWTGARMLYRYLPRCAGLKRIALHKSLSPKGDKMYLLICECSTLLQDISAAALLIPALRARLCGYTGLYRPIQAF